MNIINPAQMEISINRSVNESSSKESFIQITAVAGAVAVAVAWPRSEGWDD